MLNRAIEVPTCPGKIVSHPRFINPSKCIQLRPNADEYVDPLRSTPPRMVWKPHPHGLITDGLGLMEPEVPVNAKVPSLVQKSFDTSMLLATQS